MEGDMSTFPIRFTSAISIPALRMEGDATITAFDPGTTDFYPRPPDGGRHYHYQLILNLQKISIHALRVEGDKKRAIRKRGLHDFYPRPPGGGRPFLEVSDPLVFDFYPRPPGGGRLLPQKNDCR